MRVLIAIAIGFLVTVAIGTMTATFEPSIDFSSAVSKDKIVASEKLVDLIRTRRFDAARAVLDPSLRNADAATLEKLASFFPKGESSTDRVTGWQKGWSRNLSGGQATELFTVQLVYVFQDDSKAIVNVTFSGRSIVGIHILPVTVAQARESKLRITGLRPAQAMALALVVLLDTFAIAVFVLCLMGPQPGWRTRWLWAIATLVGLVRFNVVWPTGQVYFLPVSFLLPPATVTQIPIGSPWVLALTIPVGAIVYLLRRRARGWGEPVQTRPSLLSPETAPLPPPAEDASRS